MELREKRKLLRREKSPAQQQLADAVFVSQSAIAKWESGLGLPAVDPM